MNCLTLEVTMIKKPITVTCGLVCSVDSSPASLMSKEELRLISKDEFVLFSKN